jgi:hypothetical protein
MIMYNYLPLPSFERNKNLEKETHQQYNIFDF